MLFYQAVPDLAKEMWGYLDPAGAKGLGMTHNSIESSRLCKLFEEGKLERCFCRINSSLSFLSPLPPSVNFIGPWITPMKIVPMIIEHHKKHSTNSPSHLSVTAPVFESSSTRLPIKATGWESNTPDQAPPPPSNQQGRSPISMMTPIKPSPQPSIKATGWGDDPTAVTPEPLNEGNNDQGYGFNHDDCTRPPVKSPPRSPSDWNQTPWRNEPSPTDAILTPVTNLSSGSGGSKWESSIAATEQMTPHSPFHINEGKMGEESRASGGGDSIEGGGNIHNQVEKKAPAQLEERLFKAGASSESKLPIWYYMDQMDPDKSIYGPFDPNQMISFYLEASLGPTIFLCGLDPSAASSLESALPPKTLFRPLPQVTINTCSYLMTTLTLYCPLPQLERLCLSDGEGSEELRYQA